MTTDQIKTFITETLLQLPEWKDEFLNLFDPQDEEDAQAAAEYTKVILSKKGWKRHNKFKFSSRAEFLKKLGDETTSVDEPEWIWPTDVGPYGTYPEDGKEYTYRCFVACSADNGIRDFQMGVITDAADEKIVFINALGD